jgi:sugar phosphate isomerase/epimerase
MSEVPERGRPETIVIISSIVNAESPVRRRPRPRPGSHGKLDRARLTALLKATRRRFLQQCATAAAGAWVGPAVAHARSAPSLHFPSQPRERIAIASYPFREFIAGVDSKTAKPMDLKDFAAHVIEKFQINKIEPWTGHLPSMESKYLEQFRSAVENAGSAVANIAVDGKHSPYALDRAEREQAIAFSKKWVDNAVAIGSPSIRTNLPVAKDSKPDLDRTAESLTRVVEYASARNLVVSLENDNPVGEDPFFLVSLVEKVNSPWLHTLPDFGNTLAAKDPDYAYRGIDAMFSKAYCISHVKSSEINSQGVTVRVDMAKTFGFMRQHGYKGYCSMEWDDAGDPYQGTAELIRQTVQYLS